MWRVHACFPEGVPSLAATPHPTPTPAPPGLVGNKDWFHSLLFLTDTQKRENGAGWNEEGPGGGVKGHFIRCWVQKRWKTCCFFVVVCLFCLFGFFWGVEMDVCIDFVGLHASVLILVVCLHPRPLCFGQSVRLSVCLSTCPAVYGCMSHAFRDICLPFFLQPGWQQSRQQSPVRCRCQRADSRSFSVAFCHYLVH